MTLSAAISRIQTHAGSMTRIKSAPDTPPETAAAFPFAVTYARSGTLSGGSLGEILTDETHQIVTEVHVNRASGLGHAVEQALPYHDLFIGSLKTDPQLDNSVDIITSVQYEFSGLVWDSIQTVGYRFITTVSIYNC